MEWFLVGVWVSILVMASYSSVENGDNQEIYISMIVSSVTAFFIGLAL